MNDEQFEAFLADANQELAAKQETLMQEYGLGKYRRWRWQQETGVLQFFDAGDHFVLEADSIDIGSYAAKSHTWMWAWANNSILPWLRQKAEKLKELRQITAMDLFAKDHAFTLDDESMAWELTAMSVKHLKAVGCYRAPSSTGGPTTFLAILNLRKVAAVSHAEEPSSKPND